MTIVFKIQIVFIWGYKKLLFGFLFSNTKIFVILPEECYQTGRSDGISFLFWPLTRKENKFSLCAVCVSSPADGGTGGEK